MLEELKKSYPPDRGKWTCGRCHVPLEQMEVSTRYSHGGLLLTLPRCPKCGLTMVPKYLAEGQFVDMQTRMEDTWNSWKEGETPC